MMSYLELILGAVAVTLLAFVAVRAGAIDLSGAASGGIISYVAYLAGGLSWLVIIIIFFGVSSSLTRYRYDYKLKIGSAQEKSGKRSWPNSVANSGVAFAISLVQLISPSELLAIGFLASISTAMADTLATEIGVLSHSTPRLITNFKERVKPGTSGGVSELGELTAFLTSISMAIIGLLLYMFSFGDVTIVSVIVSVSIGAMVGTTFDSFLGATIQALYKCAVCGQFTESRTHHEQRTTQVRGFKLIENNSVNFIGILLGTLVSLFSYFLLSRLI